MGSRTITFIPRVSIGGIPTLDLATKEASFTSIPNLFDVGETITFDFYPTGVGVANPVEDIKEELIEAVVNKLEIMKNKGLGEFLVQFEGSPPVIIEIDDLDEWVRNSWDEFGGVDASFYISRVDNVNHLGNRSANEVQYTKIFLSAPSGLANDTCKYFEPDSDNLLTFDWEGRKVNASCGFQYFYQVFSRNSKRNKFVKVGEKREAKVPDGTRFDCSFRKIRWYCDNNPPQYEDWYVLFKEFVNKNGFDKIQAVSEDLVPILEQVKEIKIVDLRSPVYNSLDALNSMTILDIVKLSMWMRLNLVVFDDRDNLVLAYSRENEYHAKHNGKDKGWKNGDAGNIIVKIKDNHGWFVEQGDKVKLQFSSHGNHGFGGFYPAQKSAPEWQKNKKVKGMAEEIGEKDYKITKHPKARFRQDELLYDFRDCVPENPTPEDWEELRRQQEAPYCESSPPPTPEELISMMNEPNIYYVGKSKLNGLVDYLQRYHKIKPNSVRGLTTAIHKATYNELKLRAYHQHPYIKYKPHPEWDGDLAGETGYQSKDGKKWVAGLDSSDEEDDFIDLRQKERECIDKWKEDYPELKAYPIPHPSVMGAAVLDSCEIDCFSCFNLGMKKIFFENEIKPDFRTFSSNKESAFSLDFSKAYTNALKLMDCEWSVFDAIDEPTLFKEFDENCFYLCNELESGYPYKNLKDKGLALYHGCLLRHLKGKVEPVFQIKSFKTLKPDAFTKFTEKCYELAGDGSDNIISAKVLVNTAIGELKRKGGIKDYKLYINSDVIQLTKHLASGCPVVSLDDKPRWRGSSFMSAKASQTHHFLTGQPIRLQVIDRINELNLLLDRAVRTSLKGLSPKVVMCKTDALYYEYPSTDKSITDGLADKVNELLPDGYDVKLEHTEVEIDWDEETYNKQLPVQKFRRNWRKVKTYKEAWDKKEGADEIIKFGWDNGGLLGSGEAGTGKTEIIKRIDSLTDRNWIKLRWIRAFYKIVKGDEAPVFIKEWMKSNILNIKKYAPTNKACNNIGGLTLHRGLGLQVLGENIDEGDIDDEEEEDKTEDLNGRMMRVISKMSANIPDIIIVDEISMMGGDAWSLLSYIKFRYPEIKFFLFGDIKRQLAPVGEEGRKFDNTAVLKELTNFNKVNLSYNFRRNGDNNELWDDWSLRPKSFKVDDKPITERNLCWTNKTRKRVIDIVQNIHPDPNVWLDCEVGEDLNNTGQQKRLMLAYDTPLIARKSMLKRGVAKNEIWRIDDFVEQGVILTFGDKEETFTYDEIKKNWLSAYCITIHKAQGDTYKDNYTIWNWDVLSKRMDYDARRLRYTAQSRSTNPKELISYK